MARNAILISLLVITLLVACYCAAAGWVNVEMAAALRENKASDISKPIIFDEVQFVSEDALRRYQTARKANNWFPWMVDMPDPIALMITALAFGTVGGVTRVAFDAISNTTPLNGRSFAILGLSSLMGLLVLGVSFVIPAALTVSEATVRPVALLFFCLLGGIFYDHIFIWLKERIEKLFERSK